MSGTAASCAPCIGELDADHAQVRVVYPFEFPVSKLATRLPSRVAYHHLRKDETMAKAIFFTLSILVLLLGAMFAFPGDAPAATEAESKKKIELKLDMLSKEVEKLKGKPITQVAVGDTTTIVSYDDVTLVFRESRLVGVLGSFLPWSVWKRQFTNTKEDDMMRLMEIRWSSEEFKEFKEIHTIPSVRSGRIETETIKLTIGMSSKEVEKLKGKPKGDPFVAKINKITYIVYDYGDIKLIFGNDKLLGVRP